MVCFTNKPIFHCRCVSRFCVSYKYLFPKVYWTHHQVVRKFKELRTNSFECKSFRPVTVWDDRRLLGSIKVLFGIKSLFRRRQSLIVDTEAPDEWRTYSVSVDVSSDVTVFNHLSSVVVHIPLNLSLFLHATLHTKKMPRGSP
jgi:hypothetical protein